MVWPPRLRRSRQFAWQLTKHWLRGGDEQEEVHEQDVEAGDESHLFFQTSNVDRAPHQRRKKRSPKMSHHLLVVHWVRPPLVQVQLLQSFFHLSPTCQVIVNFLGDPNFDLLGSSPDGQSHAHLCRCSCSQSPGRRLFPRFRRSSSYTGWSTGRPLGGCNLDRPCTCKASLCTPPARLLCTCSYCHTPCSRCRQPVNKESERCFSGIFT